MEILSVEPENTCCDMRDSWNVISKFSSDFGVVVHGPSGCENELFYDSSSDHSYSFSSQLNEFDVTMGSGYEKLKDKIEKIIEGYPSIKVLFILGTCSSELIGDDIDGIPNLFADRCKVIVVHTSGMRGAGYHFTKYHIFHSLFSLYEQKKENTKKKINIFFQDGMQNEAFQKEVISFLSHFGISVNSFLNAKISLPEIKTITQVEYNYIVGEDGDFEEITKFLYTKYDIPYRLLPIPVGFTGINRFFYTICSDLGIEKKDYIIHFLSYKKSCGEKLKGFYYKGNIITNSRLYKDLLTDVGLESSIQKKDFYQLGINTSHKFNDSNKICFYNSSFDRKQIFPCNKFTTLNRYMGFCGLRQFISDLGEQKKYGDFLQRYANFL